MYSLSKKVLFAKTIPMFCFGIKLNANVLGILFGKLNTKTLNTNVLTVVIIRF